MPQSVETTSKLITKDEFELKVQHMASVNNIQKVHRVSAKTGHNINNVFDHLINQILSTQGLKDSLVSGYGGCGGSGPTVPPISYSQSEIE